MTRDEALAQYRAMLLIRRFEEAAAALAQVTGAERATVARI